MKITRPLNSFLIWGMNPSEQNRVLDTTALRETGGNDTTNISSMEQFVSQQAAAPNLRQAKTSLQQLQRGLKDNTLPSIKAVTESAFGQFYAGLDPEASPTDFSKKARQFFDAMEASGPNGKLRSRQIQTALSISNNQTLLKQLNQTLKQLDPDSSEAIQLQLRIHGIKGLQQALQIELTDLKKQDPAKGNKASVKDLQNKNQAL